MDPLSDVLRVIRLDGAFFYPVEASGSWSVDSPAARELTPRILPAAEHLIPYHILLEGTCFGTLAREAPFSLEAGDILVIPQGDAHIVSSAPGVQGDPDRHGAAPARYPETVRIGEGPPTTRFVCGFLGCDLRPFNPLLASLPRRLHLRGMSSSADLTAFTRQVTEESRTRAAGADLVLTRLAELMFISVVRRYLDELPPDQTGWLAGLRDEVVGQALALLHARPGDAWTLAELARQAGSSRTQLTERFTHLVGRPPMQYLAQWRMQLAATRLRQTDAKIASVAAESGYESEAAFSRAFKKATGLAPGAWRESRHAAQ